MLTVFLLSTMYTVNASEILICTNVWVLSYFILNENVPYYTNAQLYPLLKTVTEILVS